MGKIIQFPVEEMRKKAHNEYIKNIYVMSAQAQNENQEKENRQYYEKMRWWNDSDTLLCSDIVYN